MSTGIIIAAESTDTVQQSGTLDMRRSQMRGTPEWRHRPASIALIGALISLLTALFALAAVDAVVHQIVLGDLRNYGCV